MVVVFGFPATKSESARGNLFKPLPDPRPLVSIAAMADCEYFADEIEVCLTKMQDCVTKAKKKNIDAATMEQMQARFADLANSRFKSLVRSLKDEVYKIGNAEEKREWRSKMKKFKSRKTEMSQTMQMLQQAKTQSELGIGGTLGSPGMEKATDDEILSEAQKVSNQNVSKMKELVNVVAETDQIGKDALEKLHEQTEQIERINQEVHGFRGTVARSNKLIAIYRRRIMTDRLIWILLFIIIAGIVGLIVWSMVDPQGSKAYVSVPEEAKPPTPEEIEREFKGGRRLR